MRISRPQGKYLLTIHRLMIAGALFGILLAACSAAQSPAAAPKAVEVTPPPKPPPSASVVIGRVINKDSKAPLPGQILRLGEVVREAGGDAFVLSLGFSPAAIADENGYFIFQDVPPMEYVISVGNPDSVYEIIASQDGKAKVYEAKGGEVLDVGTLEVGLEPEG